MVVWLIITPSEHTIIRSKRRTLALIINDKGELVVRAPLRTSQREIDRFVKSKQQWIEKTQAQVLALSAHYKPLHVETGETLPYLGASYTIVRKDVPAIELYEDCIFIPLHATKDDLISWMKIRIKALLLERAEHYASLMGASYAAVKVTAAKTRWGSCSAKNNLNFTWRLALCPKEVIDYIVVHELSHVKHKNHSSSFWAHVAAVLPNYKEQRTWLRSNRRIMDLL